MRILVVGSGGREHAICHAFAQSSRVSKLFCAPGNGGIAQIAECVPIKAEDVANLVDLATRERIDLTFVGGETPLALGIVDAFEKGGLKIVGASQAAARLESSKTFAKDFMARHAIPTAAYYAAGSPEDAINTLESGHFGDVNAPVVVKADGLAAGKGVVIASDRAAAIDACLELAELVGADAAEKIVLEEFLEGKEVSLLMFANGKDFALMPPVRDHKRIGEGDTGPNTGGMGTITDAGLLTSAQSQQIIKEIIEPTLDGCIAEGFPFRGILFLGLMLTDGGPKVLEYNVRFGDPETQAILVRLESDLVDICEAMLVSKLAKTTIEWREGNSACVVLAAEGYPQKPRIGDPIDGLEDAAQIPNVTIFHAGTSLKDEGGRMRNETRVPSPESRVPVTLKEEGEWRNELGERSYEARIGNDEAGQVGKRSRVEGEAEKRSNAEGHLSTPGGTRDLGPGTTLPASFLTAGGRVLGVTATGRTLDEALATAYAAVERISWRGMQYRRDIGK